MRVAVKRSSKRRRTRPRSSASSAPSLQTASSSLSTMIARHALVDDLGHRAVAEGEHGRAARHRLDHHQTERLGPVDGEQQAARLAQEARLAALVDLADELDAGLSQQRLDLGLEVLLVDAIDLGRDLQRNADGARDADGPVDALLGRDAADESQVAAARAERRRQQVARQAVIDGGDDSDASGIGRRAARWRSTPAASRESRRRAAAGPAGPAGRAGS